MHTVPRDPILLGSSLGMDFGGPWCLDHSCTTATVFEVIDRAILQDVSLSHAVEASGMFIVNKYRSIMCGGGLKSWRFSLCHVANPSLPQYKGKRFSLTEGYLRKNDLFYIYFC